MSFLTGLHGGFAVLLICVLLFIEEAGVPLPFAPGDALLIAAGVIASGNPILLWVFLPTTFLAALGGAVTGYTWSRAVGSQGVTVIARKLRLSHALERVTARLQSTSAFGIGISRLIPGLRVTTTLMSGAAGVSLPRFLLGIVPAIAVWVVGFTLLGMVVGVPAQHILGAVGRLALEGALLVLIGFGGYMALAHLPASQRQDNALLHSPRPERFALALLVDVAIVACVVSGVAALLRAGAGFGDVDSYADVLLVIAASVAGYVLITRRGPGRTGGEALLDISYPRLL